jgi:epoxyqueuosine reductase QueG
MKTDLRLTKQIASFISGQGADLVGFAPVERFRNAPKGYGPNDYMPEATCVISIGMHLADGVCDAWGEYDEPGKSISPYLFYGYGLTNLELGRIANLVAKRLEYRGFKSLTFPPTWTVGMYRAIGLLNLEYLGADFSHRHAAVAAGLGELGWNGLAMTPIFGARVRFNSVITNAPLAPSPMYEGPTLCQPGRCRRLCVRECPTGAFSATESHVARIGERDFEYSRFDMIRCMYGVYALVKGSGSYRGVDIPPGPGNIEHYWQARQQQDGRDKAMLENCFGIICGDYCGRCLHKCPAHIYWRTGAAPRKPTGRT